MRPHALRLTAFGPFAGAVSVDLDALASSGLFLLHGPTGAGKTSLLDALGFALFGRVPGARNSAKRLRSDHALGTDRTQVQLVATLGGRRMRITRSPQQERAKSRGSGSTTEPAKVLLEEHADGVWVTVSTRMGEADAEIADLVGMSAEQFFQVVLLPQGDFAQFLRASSVDRAAVLQKLFATERFADVEAALVARRRATSVAADAARAAVEDKIARIAEVAGAALPERNSLSWATALLEQATAAEALAGQAVGSATVTRDARRVEAETATTLASRQSRRRAALLRREELARQQPELLTLHAELDAAARAAEVATALAQVACHDNALPQGAPTSPVISHPPSAIGPPPVAGRTVRVLGLAVALATLWFMLATEPALAIVWDEGYTLGREARLRLWFRALGLLDAVHEVAL